MTQHFLRLPVHADKVQLCERLKNLEEEIRLCGFYDVATMLWAAHAKLKAKRIRKP